MAEWCIRIVFDIYKWVEGVDPGGDPIGAFRLGAEASSGTDLFRLSHPSGAPQTAEEEQSLATARTGDESLAIGAVAEADSFVFAGKDDADASVARFGEIAIEPGSGPDVVVFKAGWGDDEVFGFVTGADRLDFSAISSLDLIDLGISDTADGALIEYGSNSVLLHDVAAGALTDGDFIV